MKNKVLFITEKWCDAIPEKGLTNNFHNLFGTFKKNNPDIHFSLLHLAPGLWNLQKQGKLGFKKKSKSAPTGPSDLRN